MSRVLFLIIVGLGGAAILLSLGVWQMQRLAWKEALIADINTRILADPVTLPEQPDPQTDAFLPVTVTGAFDGDTLRVLVSQKEVGAGYRLITALETVNDRILVDRGFVAVDDKGVATPEGLVTVTGNLHWPQETDQFTPEADFDLNIWFARDVDDLAAALAAEPILVVARDLSVPDSVVTPLPVDTSRIPNDHLNYANTWFSLSAIWMAMSILFMRRRRGAKLES